MYRGTRPPPGPRINQPSLGVMSTEASVKISWNLGNLWVKQLFKLPIISRSNMVILRITKTLRKTLKSRILSKYICLINLIYQNLNFGGFGQQVPQTCLSLQLIARCLKNFRSSGVKSEIHHEHHVIYNDSLNGGIVSSNKLSMCIYLYMYC